MRIFNNLVNRHNRAGGNTSFCQTICDLVNSLIFCPVFYDYLQLFMVSYTVFNSFIIRIINEFRLTHFSSHQFPKFIIATAYNYTAIFCFERIIRICRFITIPDTFRNTACSQINLCNDFQGRNNRVNKGNIDHLSFSRFNLMNNCTKNAYR